MDNLHAIIKDIKGNYSNNNLINLSINLDNNSTGKFVFNDNASNISTNTFGIGLLSNFSDIKNSIQPVFQGSNHGSNLRISDNSQKETKSSNRSLSISLILIGFFSITQPSDIF